MLFKGSGIDNLLHAHLLQVICGSLCTAQPTCIIGYLDNNNGHIIDTQQFIVKIGFLLYSVDERATFT